MRTGVRHIKNGDQFNYLFPLPKGENVHVKTNALLEDTIELMQKSINQTLEDTAALAAMLSSQDPKQTCLNIWKFTFHHIQYKEDKKGTEQVRRPARTWADRKRGVDCDCLSVFIGSILTNLNIPFSLRLTRYNEPHFEHVYPVAHLENEDIILDAVVHAFNYEIGYTEKKDIAMNLEYLNGINDDDQLVNQILDEDIPMDAQAFVFDEDLEGLEGKAQRKARKAKRKAKREAKGKTTFKEKVKKGLHVINRVNPATTLLRAGILASMKLNIMQVASKLRFAYWSETEAQRNNMDMGKYKLLQAIREKMEKIFFGAGGKPENLKKAILNGKGNRDRSVVLNGLGSVIQSISDEDNLRKILGDEIFTDEFDEASVSIEGLDGLGSIGSVSAAIAAASGVIATIANLIKKLGSLFKKGSPQQEQETIQENTDQEEEKTRKFSVKNIIQKIGQKGAALPAITTRSSELVPSTDTPPIEDPNQQFEKQTDNSTTQDTPDEEKGVIPWIKNHPFITGGIVLAATGGIYLLAQQAKKNKKKKAKSLAGVKKRKKRKSPTTAKQTAKPKTTSRRKSSTSKTKKVQKVRLL